MREIILRDGDIVRFSPVDREAPTPGENLGRAEFTVCPIWKRGRLVRAFIYRQQQRNMDDFYSIECNAKFLSVSSWTHKRIDLPELWMSSWCKEHRAMSFRLYVPINSDLFTVNTGTDLRITFDRST